MDKKHISAFSLVTLRAMATELSVFLADRYDGENRLPPQEWDELHAFLGKIMDAIKDASMHQR